MASSLAAALFFFVPAAFAGGTGGATPFNFLFLDAGARPASMGGAYTALAADSDALGYNPAGLAVLDRSEISFMQGELFQGVRQQQVSMAFRGKGKGASIRPGWGLMFNTLGVGDIQRTTLSNPTGTGLDAFSVRDMAFALGYARPWFAGLTVGGSLKVLHTKIDSESDQVPAIDLGALYRWQSVPLSFGAAVQNLGPSLRFRLIEEDLPLNLRFGLAYRRAQGGIFTFDTTVPRSGQATIHLGAEAPVLKNFRLRLGFNGRNDADRGLNFGLGLAMKKWRFDYGMAPFGDLGIAHRLSLVFYPGKKFGWPKIFRKRPAPASPNVDAKAADRTTMSAGALEDPDWEVRASAVEALGRSEDPAALGLLLNALKDSQDQVRAAAVQAMGKRRDFGALFALQDTLTDPSPRVRAAAAFALGEIGDRRATGRLKQALQDRDARVREAAKQALERIEPQEQNVPE